MLLFYSILFYLGNQRQVDLSNCNNKMCGLLYVACKTKGNAIEERNKSDKLVLEINRKWGVLFFSFLCVFVFNGFQKWMRLCGTGVQGRKHTR